MSGTADGSPCRVVVLAHPRSGSNSLVEVLTRHDAITIVSEPFNERFSSWAPGNPDYVGRLRAGEPFPALVDELFREFTGLKGLTYQFDDAALGHLVGRGEVRVVALRRRNVLQTAVSQLVAERTDLWRARDASGPLEAYYEDIGPLSLDDVRSRMMWTRQETNRLDRLLADLDESRVFRVAYEDLYEVSLPVALQLVDELWDFLALPPSRHPEISDHLSERVRQAGPSTYGRITNLRQIEAVLGDDTTGHLPAWVHDR